MILARISRRVPRYSEMLALLNKVAVFLPVVCEKSNNKKNVSPILLQVQCFSGSRVTSLRKTNPFESNNKENASPILLQVQCFSGSRVTSLRKTNPFESTQSPVSLLASRVSRAARTEAQEVLFDYLHSTRSLSFTDAEHISKNSPRFIENLVSKVGADKDLGRSLSKFLRYNPINEFEPFLESLGLSPSEIPSSLPRNLMYLTDDNTLLENFHVLCNYGIPRSNMGKMFREARGIFQYDHGLLNLKLRAYENLGLSKSTVIKLVSCSPSLLIGGVDNDFIKVQEMFVKVGFKNDWIGSYLSVEESYDWKRMVDTIYFLDKVGYDEQQLRDLLKTNPALVFEGSGKKVYVLVGRLLKIGLKMNEVYSMFVQNSQILSSKSVKNLLRAVDILLGIGLGFEDIANIVSAHLGHLCSYPLKGPKTICKELNIKKGALREIVEDDPTKLFNMCFKSKFKVEQQVNAHDPIKELEKIAFLSRLGYVENTEEMVRALKKFRGRGDRLQERFDCLVEAGLDYNVVSSLIKQAPMVLNQSRDMIEKKIDCLINCLGYSLESLIAFPMFLGYDLDRINRRFRMYAWLKDKGAVKSTLSLSSILACSDARFSKYIVDKHPEGSAFWESLGPSSDSVAEG